MSLCYKRKIEYHNLAFTLLLIENLRLNYTIRNDLHMSLSADFTRAVEKYAVKSFICRLLSLFPFLFFIRLMLNRMLVIRFSYGFYCVFSSCW